MNKRAYTLIELLSVVMILAIIIAIAYPRLIDAISISKITAYNTAKNNIVDSAKLKYLADINSAKVVEYSVDDLIDSGYLKKDIKNPLTNEKYKDTKVLITNDNNKISYEYVEGDTLYNHIVNKSSVGLNKVSNSYVFKGEECNNYLSFSGNIYRIVKMDDYGNIYVLSDIDQKDVNINNVDSYVASYYNDNYSEKDKSKILSLDILKYEDYENSFNNSDTYINNSNDIYVKVGNKNKVLSNLDNSIINKETAKIRLVLKLKNTVTYKSGDGTQIEPYIID